MIRTLLIAGCAGMLGLSACDLPQRSFESGEDWSSRVEWRFRDAGSEVNADVPESATLTDWKSNADLRKRAEAAEPVVLRLSLSDCLELGRANNRDLLIETLNVELADTSIDEALAFVDPVLSANLSANRDETVIERRFSGDTRDKNEETTFSGDVGIEIPFWTGTRVTAKHGLSKVETNSPFTTFDWSSNLEVSVRQSLLEGFGVGANRLDYDIATVEAAAARSTAANQRNTISFTVAEAYWNLVLATKDLAVLEAQAETARQNTERVIRREKEGLDKRIDVLRARSTWNQRKRDIINAKADLERASDELLKAIHPDLLYGYSLVPGFMLRVEASEQIVEDDTSLNREVPDLFEKLHIAMATRDDLSKAIADIRVAGLRVERRENLLLPTLDATLTGRLSGNEDEYGETISSLLERDSTSLSLALSFETPIGNKADAAGLKSAQIQQQQAVLRARQVETDIIAEVVDAIREVRTKIESVETAIESRALAQEEYRSAVVRQAEGFSTSLEVKEAADGLTVAERDLARARVELELARLKVLRSTGELRK